jgi:hypothetical protein
VLILEVSLCGIKFGVWCAMSATGIVLSLYKIINLYTYIYVGRPPNHVATFRTYYVVTNNINMQPFANCALTHNLYMWSENKVRELATVCLPWQHWTKVLVWFDAVDLSAIHSYVVIVGLWQSVSE